MYVAITEPLCKGLDGGGGGGQVVVVLTVWLVDACLKLLCFVLGGLSLCMVFQLLVEFVQVCVFHMFHAFLCLSSLVGVSGQFPS